MSSNSTTSASMHDKNHVSSTSTNGSLLLSSKSLTLTPESRRNETIDAAMREGAVNGILTLIPSIAALFVALKKSPYFVTRTNWQSRTAMVIMPPLFVAGLSSELKIIDKMRQIAAETEHNINTVRWAEEQLQLKQKQQQKQQQQQQQQQEQSLVNLSPDDAYHLKELYRHSLLTSDENLRVVPGDSLNWYQTTANFVATNPIQVLLGVAVPSVAWIFYGHNQKEHLQFSHKLLQTRVMGQAATLCCLLGVMGFRDFMDKNGRFISQDDADARVAEMERVREQLTFRLQLEQEHNEQMKREIKDAHNASIREKNNNKSTSKTKKQQEQQQEFMQQA